LSEFSFAALLIDAPPEISLGSIIHPAAAAYDTSSGAELLTEFDFVEIESKISR